MRQVSDDERRARIARRHGLACGHRYDDVVAATRAMTVLHATEAATVHLALWARVAGVGVADIDRALYDDRSLVKQLAMRRTLFVFPRELLPAAWGSAAARVAGQQHRRLAKFVREGGLADDPEAWIAEMSAAVLDVLATEGPLPLDRIRAAVPELDGRVRIGAPDKRWGGTFPVGRWVVVTLGAQGRLVRAGNGGHWRRNLPTWARTEDWLGEEPVRLGEAEGYAELVRRWLWTFGPGTETDIGWWLGATKAAVRKALAEVGAVSVGLEGGEAGWLLPDDTDPVDPVEPSAALLPTLDPTVMGWKRRDFYLHARDTSYLFDTNGNAGHTAWWDGRIVGAWAQDSAGVVHLLPREALDRVAERALAAEAERLTAWLDGLRIGTVYASPQMKGARLP